LIMVALYMYVQLAYILHIIKLFTPAETRCVVYNSQEQRHV